MTLPSDPAAISSHPGTADRSSPAPYRGRQISRRMIAAFGLVLLGLTVVLLVLFMPSLAVPIGAATGVVSVVAALAQWLHGDRADGRDGPTGGS